MDECRAMGIECLGPDVNESRQKFSVNSHGAIRFGLAAIKGMGDAAAQTIIDEREKNGTYKSVFDLAERVNLSVVNRKAFESLALSGGFDSFEIARQNYFGINAKGDSFLDSLIRYGQLYQQEQSQAQNSLFGSTEAIEIATPQVPQAEPWSTIETLNRERDLVGIYLSAHPLDEFDIILKAMCNTHCTELDDKVSLSKKDQIVIGGIVTGTKSKFTKTGKPCGFVTIEDFEGSGELAFFGEEWGRWKGMLVEGSTVFITAKCVQKYRDSDYYDFKISDIQYLQTVKDQRIEKFTITMDTTSVDETIVNDISTMLRDSPGNTQLYFQIHDVGNNSHVLLRSKMGPISLKHKLVTYIEVNPGMSYHVN